MLSCCRGGDDPAIDNHDDDTEPVHHDKLTKESLKYEFGRQKHDHCMCQNHEERAFCRCADEDTVAIVDAIGGLYTVFDALCQSTIRLNQYQMHRIHKLMTIKPIFRRRTRLVEKKPLFDLPDWIEDLAGLSEDTILEKKKHPQQIRSGLQPALIYGFDEDNHRLSLIPNKLGKAVFHGRALVVFCTIWMIWALFNRMDGHSYSYYLFTSIVYPLYLIPHCIGFILGFNKKAFVLVMKTFIFWIKTGHAVLYGITLIVYRHYIQDGFPILEGIELSCIVILNTLGTLVIASLDAIRKDWMSWQWKIGISLFWSVWLAYFGVHWLFLVDAYEMEIPLIGGQMSLTTLMSNFVFTQAIFFFDQSFTAYTKGEGRFILLTHSPFEEWITTKDEIGSPSFAASEENPSPVSKLNQLILDNDKPTHDVEFAKTASSDMAADIENGANDNTPETVSITPEVRYRQDTE